jgi:integrase
MDGGLKAKIADGPRRAALEALREQATVADLARERERLARDDAELRKAGKKPRTFTLLSRIHAACGSLFTFAANEEAIAASPLPRLKKGAGLLLAENAKARAFSDEEISGFWTRIDRTEMDARTRSALKLVALTAMRPGEVLGLKRRDVDLAATFVDRRGGEERIRGNGLITLRDTKNRLPRVVPLSSAARALVADALRKSGTSKDGFLFPADTEDGSTKPMAPQTLARAMSRRSDVFGQERRRTGCGRWRRSSRKSWASAQRSPATCSGMSTAQCCAGTTRASTASQRASTRSRLSPQKSSASPVRSRTTRRRRRRPSSP